MVQCQMESYPILTYPDVHANVQSSSNILSKKMGDHLFISYATEDWPFAEWLSRQLTVNGYRVWCDRFKLLGGESYPKDIDQALKTGTFRVLGVLSHFSIDKPNPVKERTMALNLAKRLQIDDFLIPINLEGLKPTELDWMTKDITFIPFSENWAEGMRLLLKKLQSINAPRPLEQGKQIAIETFLPGPILSSRPEYVRTNLLPISTIPKTIKKISLISPPVKNERTLASKVWAHWFVSDYIFLALNNPPAQVFGRDRIRSIEELEITSQKQVCGIPMGNILSSLLDKSLRVKCLEKGLRQTPDFKAFYFPAGLIQGNKLTFQSYTGKLAWILTTGQRSYRQAGVPQKYIYHLGVRFRVRKDIGSVFHIQMAPTVYFSDLVGNALSDRSAASKRKQISRIWRNHQWFMRILAISNFLSDGSSEISTGNNIEDSVRIATQSVTLLSPISIDESALAEATPYISFEDADLEEVATDTAMELEDSSV